MGKGPSPSAKGHSQGNDERIRTFIAVEVPEEIKVELRRVQEELKRSGADVRWVRSEGIHLTLKFLGEVEPSIIPRIKEGVEGLAQRYRPFRLDVEGMGCFPTIRSPRVIWIGLSGDDGRLSALQRDIEELLKALGFLKEDRPFRPHLTLGRVRSKRFVDRLVERIGDFLEIRLGSFEVGSVVQFRSHLSPSGATYRRLWEVPLGGFHA